MTCEWQLTSADVCEETGWTFNSKDIGVRNVNEGFSKMFYLKCKIWNYRFLNIIIDIVIVSIGICINRIILYHRLGYRRQGYRRQGYRRQG